MKQVKVYEKMIGIGIRERRRENNMSKKELAEKIGVRPQQLQKYEEGDQISAGRLFVIAQTLETPIEVFFPPSETAKEIEKKMLLSKKQNQYFDCLTDEITMEAAQMFHKLKDPTMRAAVMQLIDKLTPNEFIYDF